MCPRPFIREPEPGPARNERRTIWEEFCNDQELLKLYNVKADELEDVKKIALLGNLRNKQDFVFMLNVVRRHRR
jgi:hypothetical protein